MTDNLPKRVTVWWHDAHHSGEELAEEMIDQQHKPLLMASTGWLAKEDETGVSLVIDYVPDEGNEGLDYGKWGHPVFLPRGMILRVDYLTDDKVQVRGKAQNLLP